jgi:hypothetical protein
VYGLTFFLIGRSKHTSPKYLILSEIGSLKK